MEKSSTYTTLDRVSLTETTKRSTLSSHDSLEAAAGFLDLPTLVCRFTASAPDIDNVHSDLWLKTEAAVINLRAEDGVVIGPVAFVRFLWNHTDLFFYVEVEEQQSSDDVVDNGCVWNGNNMEFLIAPRWHKKPLYDEYEFVFNRAGCYNDMHWLKGGTLEDSLQWNAEGLELKFFQRLHINTDLSGWSFQGRIPFKTFMVSTPGLEDSWRIGLFRKHYAEDGFSFLAWSPPLNNPPRFHTPERFGTLVFR